MPTITETRPASKALSPFALPHELTPDLCRVLDYWEGLLRGEATIPFADDVRLTDMPDLAPNLFLVDVFDRPERFRLDTAGAELGPAQALVGRFIDEIALEAPLQFLRSQCAAAVEAAEPTFFHCELGVRPYSRLLLPTWGEGRISMLLGAVDVG